MFAFWQMVWEQEVFLVVTLSSIDSQECLPFWPSSGQIGETLSWENPTKTHQIRVVMIEEVDAPSRRAIRVSLEVCLSEILFVLNYLYFVLKNLYNRFQEYFSILNNIGNINWTTTTVYEWSFCGNNRDSRCHDLPDTKLASTLFSFINCF